MTRAHAMVAPSADGSPVKRKAEDAVVARPDLGCTHTEVEDLGLGAAARFLRCTRCGAVVVSEKGKHWILGAANPPIPRDSTAGMADLAAAVPDR